MPDGDIQGLVTRSHGLLIRAIREKDREADFIASTDTIDSYDEVIDQASWRLDRFRSNPVILYGHQSYELPIGQATRCEIVNGQLECTIRFASAEANPRAEQVWQLVKEKTLRAVSVGFRPSDGKYELRDNKEVFVLYGCDLREISVVAIGANPDALAKMKSAALLARAEKSAEQNPGPKTNVAVDSKNKSAANDGAPEKNMDPKELQDRLEKSEASLISAKAAEKAATDKLASVELELATAKKANDTLSTEKSAFEAQTKTLAEQRDAEKKRADEAEEKLVELEVDGLVGKKIKAAEKADFVALRKLNKDLFDKMVAQRSDLGVLEKAIAGSKDESGVSDLGREDLADVTDEIEKLAG